MQFLKLIDLLALEPIKSCGITEKNIEKFLAYWQLENSLGYQEKELLESMDNISNLKTYDQLIISSDILGEDKNISVADFDVYPFYEFGFTENHLQQLKKLKKISIEDIEQSLIEFHYDYVHKKIPKIKTSPINFLMGLFRKGTRYVSEHYQIEMTNSANEMIHRYEKRKQEDQKVAILKWFEELNDSDKNQLLKSMPPHLFVRYKVNGLLDKDIIRWLTSASS